MTNKKKELILTFTVADLSKMKRKLAQASDSVDEVQITHALPYLTPTERIAFVNELQRVMKKGAKCQLLSPHWSCSRAYADLRMCYPPVVEGWYFNLSAEFRKRDPNGDKHYKCDFDVTFGYSLHPTLVSRNQEYQQHAVTFWKEAAQDLSATIIKR